MPTWLALVGAYLIGSLDFAVVVAQAKGVDIREVGSGNPGTSNVLRTLGRGPAAMVLLGDSLKGVIAAALGWLAAGTGGDPALEPLAYAAGFLAVVGHAFPIFHKFKGGKGVATAAGAMFFTLPLVAVVIGVVWATIAKIWKVASIASLTGLALAIPGALLMGVSGDALVWLGAMLVLIVFRHRPNIERMLSGSEKKVPT